MEISASTAEFALADLLGRNQFCWMPLWGMVFQLKGQEYSAESEANVKRRVQSCE